MRVWRHIAGVAAMVASAGAAAPAPQMRWIGTWGSAQLALEPKDALPDLSAADGVTVQQRVRLSAGGSMLRVRLSNAFGPEPLLVGHAAVRIDRTTLPLAFAGAVAADIPPGAETYSDPVRHRFAAGTDVTILFYLANPASARTGHPGARATTHVMPGDRIEAATPATAVTVPRWFALSDIETAANTQAGTIVAIGDSITDGYGVAPDSHGRWTDTFVARLRTHPELRSWGVVNAGIGGNRVTRDGLGPNLVARFDRDVIARSGVRFAIVLEGINDIGTLTRDRPASPAEHAALVRRITAGYAQVVARAHAHGITVIGGTITPFMGNDYYHPDAANEADRQAVNAFIRNSGTFDAVVDFDAALRDPSRPDRLRPAYDSGDHLHHSMGGYRAMGTLIPLTLFSRSRARPPLAGPATAINFGKTSK